MNRIGELMGGATRGNIVEALALSERPLTAYRVAATYHMNIAKVYSEMKRLNKLGLVRSAGAHTRGTEYELADDDLRRLALKLRSRVQTYEFWRSAESKRERFRMGLVPVPAFELGARAAETRASGRRMPGELENLAVLGRKKFESKYRRTAGREYDRV